MTSTASRLAELDRISRERELTDDEQVAVMRLARAKRYRQHHAGTIRERRRAYESKYRVSKAEAAQRKARDEQGRFV